MSKMNWTPAQRAAIDHRGGSLLVTAAAGSGKTAVLTERVVSLLADKENPVQADRLLIVTFTKAAAAELRGRISRRIEEVIRETAAEKGRNAPEVVQLHSQKIKLQRASIGTMDAFCLSLLQKNFAVLDIPPDFTTADEGTLFRLRQESLTAVLEQAYDDPDFRAFADLYGRSRSDEQAGKAVLALYDFLRSLPAPRATLERFCGMWENAYPLEYTPWSRVLCNEALERAEAVHHLALIAAELASQSEAGQEKYEPAMEQDAAMVSALADALSELATRMNNRPEEEQITGAWEETCAALDRWKWPGLGRILGEKSPNEEASKAVRDSYKDEIKKLRTSIFLCSSEEFEEDCRRAAPMVRALARAVIAFEDTYFAAKCAEKVLEFSDFEHLALRLLRDENGDPSPMAATIAADYDVVMVDEYQDTNALQDAVYKCISGLNDRRRFLVGDLKQSIYRFRQADPTVFMEKLVEWPMVSSGEIVPNRNISLALDANFRSAPAVVAGINYFFEMLMSESLGGVVYGDGQRLVAGAAMPEQEDGSPYTGFCEVDAVEEGNDAVHIARRIRELVESGYPVREKDALRPCQYGDFCILLRTRNAFERYTTALEWEGVPVYADVMENLLDAPQVRPFVSLLRVLDNPAQDIPLASVMLSPIYGFTPDDLLKLRAKTRHGSLYGALMASDEEKMITFRREMDSLRRLARTLPVPELMEEILARTGYLAAVGAMPGGALRQAGLRDFVRWANGAGKGGLTALLRNMDAAAELGGIPSGDHGQTQAGCVSVMTVHRSKGLEFPIVFVADCSHKFNLQDTTGAVLFHPELGIGLTLRPQGGAGTYKTLQHAAISRALRAESMSEEMRVLYVALTRARDGLIITLPINGEGALEKTLLECVAPNVRRNALKRGRCWADWLLSAAMLHPDAECLRAGRSLLLTPEETESAIAFKRYPGGEDEKNIRITGGLPTAVPDDSLLAALEEKFSWRDERRILRSVPGKVSVTAVVHGREDTLLQRPAFMYKDGLTGAERGTATHTFLQAADMAAAARDLEGEIERQKALLLLAPELADKLDRNMLQRFFSSAVYERITKAEKVWREYAFITSLPAKAAMEDKTKDYGDALTLVQGVADLVLIFPDHAEIVDYKTDRNADAAELAGRYRAQLLLYRYALEKRLPVPITRLTIYGLALGAEVDIPLENL